MKGVCCGKRNTPFAFRRILHGHPSHPPRHVAAERRLAGGRHGVSAGFGPRSRAAAQSRLPAVVIRSRQAGHSLPGGTLRQSPRLSAVFLHADERPSAHGVFVNLVVRRRPGTQRRRTVALAPSDRRQSQISPATVRCGLRCLGWWAPTACRGVRPSRGRCRCLIRGRTGSSKATFWR